MYVVCSVRISARYLRMEAIEGHQSPIREAISGHQSPIGDHQAHIRGSQWSSDVLGKHDEGQRGPIRCMQQTATVQTEQPYLWGHGAVVSTRACMQQTATVQTEQPYLWGHGAVVSTRARSRSPASPDTQARA